MYFVLVLVECGQRFKGSNGKERVLQYFCETPYTSCRWWLNCKCYLKDILPTPFIKKCIALWEGNLSKLLCTTNSQCTSNHYAFGKSSWPTASGLLLHLVIPDDADGNGIHKPRNISTYSSVPSGCSSPCTSRFHETLLSHYLGKMSGSPSRIADVGRSDDSTDPKGE